MCTPDAETQGKQSGGKKIKAGLGARLDKAQRVASATTGGGTYGSTIMDGTPKNAGVDAQRKISLMGV